MFNSKLVLAMLAAAPVHSMELEQGWLIDLPALNGNPDTVTVSGSSAGGYWSNHVLLTMSDTFKGAGIQKGGPFLAQMFGADKNDEDAYPVEYYVKRTKKAVNKLDELNWIDDKNNLPERAAYVISGLNDPVVPPHNQEAVVRSLEELGVPDVILDERDSGHEWEVDAAHTMIEHIYSVLGYPDIVEEDRDYDWKSNGTFKGFSQKEFFPTITDEQWENDQNFKGREYAGVYVPKACGTDAKQCNVHFALHGCGGDPYGMAVRRGYNALGALNDIIMIYPDTACWGLGDIDDRFYTNFGVLNTAFQSMVDRVTNQEE